MIRVDSLFFMRTTRKTTFGDGQPDEAPRHPDLAYWQTQPDEKKFDAAWQIVIDAYAMNGVDISKSRMNKTIGGLRRFPKEKT